MHSRNKELLLKAYAAFNRQDADTLLSLMSDKIDWPDDEKRLHGKPAVRQYWLKRWTKTLPHDEPVDMWDTSGETSVVRIHQIIYKLNGSVVSKGELEHMYQIKDGLILRMDINKL